MDIQEFWEKALRKTEIVRPRVRPLETYAATHLPYVFLAESSVNPGDTVVRKGEVVVEKPSLVLPFGLPQFEGFDFEKELHMNENNLINFFLVRGVNFPSLKYNNRTDSLNVFEGKLSKAVEHHLTDFQRNENVQSGLMTGPEDAWPFSVLIFACNSIAKSADNDIRRLFEDRHRKGPSSS